MKNYVVERNNELFVVKANKPTGDWASEVVAEISDELVDKKLQKSIVQDEFGMDVVVIEEDSAAQAAAEAAKAQVEEDLKWATLRAERNRLLAETDYTQLADSPHDAPKKAEYATYRQALRDLPSNTVDPENPSYPSKPE